ncbi:MAG: hypothetical protein AMK72_10905, partial [Planctomycetes bacterium SM23_25]
MTFKRVMLVVLPVMAAVFLFMALRWVYLDWEAGLTDYQPAPGASMPKMPSAGKEMPTRGGFGHGRTENLNLVRRDLDGRMEMRLLADVVEHSTEETANIERPRIQFFTKAGEIITLLADKGFAVTTGKGQLANVADIKSGRLWGNVVLVHDRGTPDDDADDTFVGLEDVEFDNETYEMSTDGPVVMAGGEMSLTANKMRMALDRETRRITKMKFFHDIFITLETGQSMNFLQGDRKEKKTPGPEVPAPPGAAQPPPAPDAPGDLWRMDLDGDVDARQDTQRLRCEHLSLYNRQSQPGAVPETGAGDASVPAAEGKKESRPQVEADRKALLLVVADGPLTITPIAQAQQEALGDKQHQVTASGKPVRIEDGETVILGDAVQFNQETGVGTVIGRDEPIVLEQPGRLYLTGRRLDFDRSQVPPTVKVSGEGRLQAKVQTAGLSVPAAGGTSAAEPAKPAEPSPLDASWKRGMGLELYSLPSDETGGLGEIKSAEFHGQASVE